MVSQKWREYFFTLAIAIFLALVVRFFVFTAYRVPTGSMQPTLKPGDFIFASRLSYLKREPQRLDVVVFQYPNQSDVSYVKRVVAIAGDKVELKKGQLFLNGKPSEYVLDQDPSDNPNPQSFQLNFEKQGDRKIRILRLSSGQMESFGPVVVPPGEVFLMGDNRDASEDSRYWGSVPLENVKGRVVLIWFSLNSIDKRFGSRFPQVRWDRIFSTVQ